jgi:hypothetical protein
MFFVSTQDQEKLKKKLNVYPLRPYTEKFLHLSYLQLHDSHFGYSVQAYVKKKWCSYPIS